jgi:lipopolysaccharide O-acetyltransferase
MILITKSFKLYKSIGLIAFLRLIIDLIFSKIIFPKARIIRRPYYIRNEGTFVYGRGFSTGPGLIIDVFGENAKLEIGNNVMAFHNLHIGVLESVIIGDRVLIASSVYISDHSHGNYSGENQSSPIEPPVKRRLKSLPIKISDDVWLGERVTILPGVSIGKGTVVGAGSVVTSNLPENVIAAGIPAKIIKFFDFKQNKWVKYHNV